MEKPLCIECGKRPIENKKRQLCLHCYRQLRYMGLLDGISSGREGPLSDLKLRHQREIEFIQNYFTHKNWICQPARFRFNGQNYEPDFYDGQRNVWIEVAGSRQRYHAMKHIYNLFRKAFPALTFEIRKPSGELLNSANLPDFVLPGKTMSQSFMRRAGISSGSNKLESTLKKEGVMEEIILSIDCYQCGNKLQFDFKPNVSGGAYYYCPDCQEGIQVHFDGQILSIDRLEQE